MVHINIFMSSLQFSVSVVWQARLPYRNSTSFQSALSTGRDGPHESWWSTWLRSSSFPAHPASTPTAPLPAAAPSLNTRRTGKRWLHLKKICKKSLGWTGLQMKHMLLNGSLSWTIILGFAGWSRSAQSVQQYAAENPRQQVQLRQLSLLGKLRNASHLPSPQKAAWLHESVCVNLK